MGTNWNDFLGFKKTFPEYKIKNYKIIDLPKLSWPATSEQYTALMKKYECSSISDDENIILQTQPGQSLAIDWSHFLNSGLREGYDEARQEDPVGCYFDTDFTNIGVHVRRGDISPEKQPERWIFNEQYVELFRNINNTLNSDCLIHIYSEGDISDFGEISKIDNVLFHLNEDPMVTFHHLVSSDILINAKSAFSVLAAYLHNGIKLCLPFSTYWKDFPNNENFISVDGNYNFDSNKLMKGINNGF